MIPASFHFVRTEPRARHAPLAFRKRLTSLSSYWALHRFRSAHEGLRSDSRSCRNLQDLSYQKPLRSIQLQEGCLDPNLVLEPTALDLADLTASTTTSTFRTHPPAAVRVFMMIGLELGLVHFTIRWSALPFHRRNGWCVTGIFGSLSKLYFVFTF